MSKYRGNRINEEIKKHVSSIIQNKLKDPRIGGLVSVTRVDVTRDLSYAKVYVSIFGDEKLKSETFEALKQSSGFIRSELGHNVRIRHVPQVLIELDESLEYGMKINTILGDIKKNGDKSHE
jgi:ribosome-binding factor A